MKAYSSLGTISMMKRGRLVSLLLSMGASDGVSHKTAKEIIGLIFMALFSGTFQINN
jgi:hypothetical protein